MDTFEKKYNEALSKCKAYIDDTEKRWSEEFSRATEEVFKEIFPELRESEDEWIPKELIEYLKQKGDYRSCWIAWLEKQKEQKPILEVFGFKVGDAVRLKDGDRRKHIIKSFEEVEGIHGPNFYHVEFEDNSARDGIYPGEEYPNGYYTHMEKFEEEQKPAEWSEEDENNLNKLLQWDGIPLGLRSWVSGLPEKVGTRPSWKPSEKQMKALNAMNCYGELSYQGQQQLLIDLYQQLKKL